MNGFGKIRKFAGVMPAIGLGLLVALPASGAIAYLPSIGPAPLRYEPATDPDALLAWKSLRLAQRPAADAGVPAPATPTLTNANNEAVWPAGSSPATNTSHAAAVPVPDPGATTNSDMIPDFMRLPDTSNDSSGPVTPQLLAGFFKPGPGGKNPDGTAVFVPMEIGFTPPSPKPAPESRATYKTQ